MRKVGSCPVKGVPLEANRAWQRWYIGVATRWKRFVRETAHFGRAKEVVNLGSITAGGGVCLQKWREHLLVRGDRYSACVRCWRYGTAKCLSWSRLPCKFGVRPPPRGLVAVFESGDFAGRPCLQVRRPLEAQSRLQNAGLWHLCSPVREST